MFFRSLSVLHITTALLLALLISVVCVCGDTCGCSGLSVLVCVLCFSVFDFAAPLICVCVEGCSIFVF